APPVPGLLAQQRERGVLADKWDARIWVVRLVAERPHVDEARQPLSRAELGAEIKDRAGAKQVSDAENLVAHVDLVGERPGAGAEAEVVEDDQEVVGVVVIAVEGLPDGEG